MSANFEIYIFSTGPIPISECLRIPEVLKLPAVPGVCTAYPDWTFGTPLRENLPVEEIWEAAGRGEIVQIFPLTEANSGIHAYREGEKYAVEIWLSTELIPNIEEEYVKSQFYYNDLSCFFMDNPAFSSCVAVMGVEMALSTDGTGVSCHNATRMVFPRGLDVPEAAYLTSPVHISVKNTELTEPERQWLETMLACDFLHRDEIVRQIKNSELRRDYPGGYLSMRFHVDESEDPVYMSQRVNVSFLAFHGKSRSLAAPWPKDFLLHVVKGHVDELEVYDVAGDGISPEFRLDGMGLEFTFR